MATLLSKVTKSKAKKQSTSFDLDNILNKLPTPAVTFTGGAIAEDPPDEDFENKYVDKQYPNSSGTLVDLSGYVEISKSELKSSKGIYIRYLNQNDILMAGGYIIGVEQDDSSDFNVKISGYGKTRRFWTVKLSKMRKIFKLVKSKTQTQKEPETNGGADVQPTHEDKLMSQIGDKLLFTDESKIITLESQIADLKKDNEKIALDVKKLFVLIKRLYTMLGPQQKPAL